MTQAQFSFSQPILTHLSNFLNIRGKIHRRFLLLIANCAFERFLPGFLIWKFESVSRFSCMFVQSTHLILIPVKAAAPASTN